MHITKFKNDTNNNIDSETIKKKIKEYNENFSKKFNNLGKKGPISSKTISLQNSLEVTNNINSPITKETHFIISNY